MGVSVGHLCYLGWWYVRALAGRRKPLQSVIFLLDRCNLKCRHCSVYAIAEPRVQTYEQIRSQLQYCYDEGSRYVDFEGGELYLWQDGDKCIDDVIDLAHEIGFWSVTITTNAQLPFANSHADQVWVSLDGVGEMHDRMPFVAQGLFGAWKSILPLPDARCRSTWLSTASMWTMCPM